MILPLLGGREVIFLYFVYGRGMEVGGGGALGIVLFTVFCIWPEGGVLFTVFCIWLKK